MKVRAIACAVTAIMVTAEFASAQSPPSTFPGGASSLRETFQDWQVSCVAEANTKRCSLSQEQVGQNRQRLLAIELAPGDGNGLTGTLILPFGLLFEPPINMQVDDKPVGKPLRIRTCVPTGCIVPLRLEGAVTNTMRAGSSLKITAMPSESGDPITFSISLKGFPAAINRTTLLTR